MGRRHHNLVRRHLSHFYPGIPEKSAIWIARRVSGREWRSLTLGVIVSIVLTSYVRHRLTRYEKLLAIGEVSHNQARALVAADLQQVLRRWEWGHPLNPISVNLQL
jgi:hypothetical protein